MMTVDDDDDGNGGGDVMMVMMMCRHPSLRPLPVLRFTFDIRCFRVTFRHTFSRVFGNARWLFP